MNFDESQTAIEDAKITMRRADIMARQVAGLITGRLRISGVSTWVLEELKRELKDYNIHTGCWK